MAEAKIKARLIVMEIRTNDDGSISNTVTSFAPDDRAHADNKYHSVLAAAAISEKVIHSFALMTAEGFVLDYKCFKRGDALPEE